MSTVIAQAFVDASAAKVLALEMLSKRMGPEDAVDARLRARVATFAAPARTPAEDAALQLFVIRRGDQLLGWIQSRTTPNGCSFAAVRCAIEAAIGESLQEFVRSVVDRDGTYVATRIGRSSSARACAEAAALVGVQCGWDESEALDVSIDGERFALRATFDRDRREWLFDTASLTAQAKAP